MKKVFLSVLFSVISIPAFACPAMQAEYTANACPVAGKSFKTVKIYQPNCNTVGFQNLTRGTDGAVTTFGPVEWRPVDAGNLPQSEDATYVYYANASYDDDSLNTYNYRVEKKTGKMVLMKAEIINLIVDGNLFISDDGFTAGTTWFNIGNCGYKKP